MPIRPTCMFKVKGKLPDGEYRILCVASVVLAVYDDGRIWNVRFARWQMQEVDQDGYHSLGGIEKVHRLVLLAFVGPPPTKGHLARHLNGNPGDNRLCNLRWGTAKENWADKRLHGTATVREKHGRAKLTEEAVIEIRAAQKGPRYRQNLADKFNVSAELIYAVRKGAIWK